MFQCYVSLFHTLFSKRYSCNFNTICMTYEVCTSVNTNHACLQAKNSSDKEVQYVFSYLYFLVLLVHNIVRLSYFRRRKKCNNILAHFDRNNKQFLRLPFTSFPAP